ncbi:MAG: hypothetical protein RLZZ352_550 [Pseudomonadota bacterium]|jgi:hypothetical protein
MNLMLDAFWRAAAYCLHPRVIGLSLLPLVLLVSLSLGLGYFYWDAALASVTAWLEDYALMQAFLGWLERVGLGNLRTVFAPLLIVVLSTPVMIVLCLLFVSLFMTSAMATLVAQRRFPGLARLHGGSLLTGVLWSLGSTALALVALLLSLPLWLVPPLALIIPPLIWGWLTFRVFAFDALANHASAAERQQLLREHRNSLLFMGVISGYLGAAPSLLWASGALFVVFAPLLVPLALWLYTLVFAFASLWFAHYTLQALQQRRTASQPDVLDPVVPHDPSATGLSARPLQPIEDIQPRAERPDTPANRSF